MRRLLSFQNLLVLLLTCAVAPLADSAVADHVPDNLSQDVDPNYVACLMAVDDAEREFLGELQNTCFKRMVEICTGRDASAPPSQVIDCIYLETGRAMNFLQSALTELPEAVESGGFFEGGYERQRDSLLEDLETVSNSPKPESTDVAIQQSAIMAVSATTLFYLARETGTHLQSLVAATFSDH